MPFHLTTDGAISEHPADSRERENAAQTVLTSRNEWEAIAGAWPLKRLVEIWNALPGVRPVGKFTSRQIALERIWRAVESPDQAAPNRRRKLESAFETAPKRPRCMPCSAVRKERRSAKSRASRDGSG